MVRYHPFLVTLHWILALMILGSLIAGNFILAETANSDPEKMFALKMHMGMGIAILLFMIIRLIVRLRTPIPPKADTGNGMLNRLGSATHWILYLLVFLMCVSGIGISITAGLPDIVFFGSGDALPVDFDDLLPFMAHELIAKALVLLLAMHVAAALFHQFIRKDGLFSRMWFARRK